MSASGRWVRPKFTRHGPGTRTPEPASRDQVPVSDSPVLNRQQLIQHATTPQVALTLRSERCDPVTLLFLRSGTPAVVVTAILTTFAGHPVAASDILGKHVVQKGETLYCIGRAYGIHPNAIANANGVGSHHLIYPGQILTFPRVWWERVPSGPVCRRQWWGYAGRYDRYDADERLRYSEHKKHSHPYPPSLYGR